MHPSEFFICYTTELNDLEKDIANKYWEFSSSVDIYKYGTAEINLLFNDLVRKKLVSNIVKKLCFIGSSRYLSCSLCNQQFALHSRAELKLTLKNKTRKCNICIKKELQQQSDKYIKSLKKHIDNFSLPQRFGAINSLSYIELIYLMQLLNCTNDHNLINTYNYISSKEFDEIVINSLISKGFLFYYKDQESERLECDFVLRYYNSNRKIIDFEHHIEFENLKSRLPKFGLYLLTTPHNSIEKTHQELLNHLQTIELPVEDLRDIQRVVLNTLTYKLLRITQEVENHYKIKVNKDERFHQAIQFIILNYSMMQAYNILYFQGEKVASDIHAGKLNAYSEPNALTTKLQSYLSYLKLTPEAKVRFKNIPSNITSTEIEIFTTRYIFENTLNWITLSGQEIISRWTKSPTVKF